MAFAKSIRQRLDTARRSLSDGSDPRAGMAAALLLLFAAGTLLALAAIPLSDDLSRGDKLAELVICDLAAAACLVIAVGWRRLPPLAFQLLLLVGTLMISAGTYFASNGPTACASAMTRLRKASTSGVRTRDSSLEFSLFAFRSQSPICFK